MNNHTQIKINYHNFTNQIKDLMLLARVNARAVESNRDSFEDPDAQFAAFQGRSHALYAAWQIACGSDYKLADANQLADLLV